MKRGTEGRKKGRTEGKKAGQIRRVTQKSGKMDYFQSMKWSKISKDLQRSSSIRLEIISEDHW